MSNPRPFPVDPKLTGIALAYRNSEYIADKVMPRVKVPSSTFRYRVFSKDTYLTIPDTMVGRKSEPNEAELGFSEDSAFVVDYGLDDVIPYDDMINAPEGYNPQYEAVEYLSELIALDREKRVANIVFDASNYAASCKTTLTGSAQFSDNSSAPLDVLTTALEAPFVRPNTVVMGRDVWAKLCRHPQLVQTVYPLASGNGIITPDQLATMLDVSRVLIGSARVNTAKRGTKVNIDRCWGKHVALLYLDNSASTNRGLTWGLTAEFGQRVSGSMPAPETGLRGATRVRVGESVCELVMASDAGYLITNAIA